ncbi:hypothetical protein [Vibrio comitans]
MKKVLLIALLVSGVASASVFATEMVVHHGMMDGTSMEQMTKDHPMMAKVHQLMGDKPCIEAMQEQKQD